MAKKEKSYGEILTAGFIKENPVLRLVLGTCPTLAVTTQAFNGLGMGAAATLVLIGSNAVISLFLIRFVFRLSSQSSLVS